MNRPALAPAPPAMPANAEWGIGPAIARTLRRLAQAGGTPRATLAYALLTAGWAAFVYAAWLAWGPAAAVAVGGVGALAWGGLLLFAETVPDEDEEGGQGG